MSPPPSRLLPFATAAALIVSAPALAQGSSGQERFSEFLGALLGRTTSLDAQWMRGARPLTNGRAQFEARLSADVRSGAIPSYAANRLRADYDALVDLERRYGADGRFSAEERADLNTRYGALTGSLEQGGPADDNLAVAEGQAEFDARVSAALRSRLITRSEATALRSEYQTLIQAEAAYARDGVSARERADLDRRLDGLDERLGDAPQRADVRMTPRERLAELQRTLAAAEQSGIINRREAAELRTQHGDLVRLEAAYARTASADDRAYLDRRISELESRAQSGRRSPGQ